MRFRVVLCLVLSALAFLVPRPARAQLTTIETDNLRLIYDEITLGYIAPHAARCFENALRFHRALFEYTEEERVTVLLSDFGDTGNAGAGSTPRNIISILVAPVSFAFETYSANERINTLMNHELVHIVAVDMPHGSDRFFRGLFGGKVKEIPEHPETILFGYLTTPRDSAPRWFHEGIAVFLETWMAGGLGRALGAYDEMVFRSMVKDGTRFYDPLGLESEGTKTDFQAGVNSYLYGTRFMSYLAVTYSPEKLIEWTSRGSGSKKYYAANFKKTFGRSLSDVWRDWIEWEHTFQKKNLAAVAEYPITPYRDISDRGLGSVSRAHVDRDRGLLYAAVNYPGTVSHVAAISLADGSIEKLIDIKGSSLYTVTSLAFDPESGLLFYTTDNYEWRDLRCLDPETGDSRTLIDDVRVGDLVFNQMDRSLWGIRHYNGISTLVRIAYPWKDWDQVYSWPYGEGLYDLDLSPGGGLLSGSFTNIEGKQSLHVYAMVDLIEGVVEPIATTTFGTSVPSNFAFSPDGKYLYGSSYYTGIANIFRYELATDSLNAVSNCETGFFRPIPLGADSLIVFRYTGEGFVPSRVELKPVFDVNAITFLGQQVVEKHPVVTSWTAGSPMQVNLDEIMTYKGPYRSVAGIRSESIYPIVGGYKDVPVYGLRLNLSDPLRMNKIGLDVAYSPDLRVPEDERAHVSLGYE
ncbi:MAG: hypothetical protein HKN20_05365, partial [Gemmatimonadetes bacterium]|nr:hypothetical protein [Gemmatimonadota bacterium]